MKKRKSVKAQPRKTAVKQKHRKSKCLARKSGDYLFCDVPEVIVLAKSILTAALRAQLL